MKPECLHLKIQTFISKTGATGTQQKLNAKGKRTAYVQEIID